MSILDVAYLVIGLITAVIVVRCFIRDVSEFNCELDVPEHIGAGGLFVGCLVLWPLVLVVVSFYGLGLFVVAVLK